MREPETVTARPLEATPESRRDMRAVSSNPLNFSSSHRTQTDPGLNNFHLDQGVGLLPRCAKQPVSIAAVSQPHPAWRLVPCVHSASARPMEEVCLSSKGQDSEISPYGSLTQSCTGDSLQQADGHRGAPALLMEASSLTYFSAYAPPPPTVWEVCSRGQEIHF